MQATGLFSWLALWTWRRSGRVAPAHLAIVLILSVITFGLMTRAANLGGSIRHPEIHATETTEPAAEPSSNTLPNTLPNALPNTLPNPSLTLARSWGQYVVEHGWVWPTFEALHYVGLCLLFTAALFVDLRVLGLGRRMSFAAVHQLLPVGLVGLTINLATGLAFFVATPMQYTGVLFLLKMSLVVVGAANLLYFMIADDVWRVGEDAGAPLGAKLAAAAGLAIWIAIVFCGRMLPALGNAF